MSIFLAPYLTFAGNAREAMTFYADVFGGEAKMMTAAEMPGSGAAPEMIMHAELRTGWINLFAADNCDGSEVKPGNDTTLCLMGQADDRAEGERIFAALAEGGVVTLPLAQQMWGDVYGQLVDKFGRQWSMNIGGAHQA